MSQLALPLLLKSLSKEERKENEGLEYVLPNIYSCGTVIIGGKKVRKLPRLHIKLSPLHLICYEVNASA